MSQISGYLFATFKSESGPMGEQVYFVLSEDGLDWQALNQSRPVLVSNIGERGVRDPFLIRAQEGDRFFLIGTDLSIHHNPDWGRAVRQGSRAIIIWESTNLLDWSEPRRVEVAPDNAGCTWAPEAIYNPEKEAYLVFWASTTADDNFSKHRIWAAYTEDFREFGDAFLFIEEEHGVIDTTIAHDNGSYHRFTKDETNKRIYMESAEAISGPWKVNENFSLRDLRGYEGPQCFPVQGSDGQKKWMLILDNYARQRGYQAFITTDLASGEFAPFDSMTMPFHLRHGSVIPLQESEYMNLVEDTARE